LSHNDLLISDFQTASADLARLSLKLSLSRCRETPGSLAKVAGAHDRMLEHAPDQTMKRGGLPPLVSDAASDEAPGVRSARATQRFSGPRHASAADAAIHVAAAKHHERRRLTTHWQPTHWQW
jgi:hypothetical protein